MLSIVRAFDNNSEEAEIVEQKLVASSSQDGLEHGLQTKILSLDKTVVAESFRAQKLWGRQRNRQCHMFKELPFLVPNVSAWSVISCLVVGLSKTTFRHIKLNFVSNLR
ncbi:hypothetical protein CHU98_g2034 [Xylaria longipes]|nr:hypothetical protein CHU98_g2034 [Xylaria longipes]